MPNGGLGPLAGIASRGYPCRLARGHRNVDTHRQTGAASVEIGARNLGFAGKECESAALATVRAYRKAMLAFARMRNVAVWYARLPGRELKRRMVDLADPTSAREVKRRLRKAMQRDHLPAFSRLVTVEDGDLQVAADPPVLVPVSALLDDEQRERYVEVVQEFLMKYRTSLPPGPGLRPARGGCAGRDGGARPAPGR